MSFHGLLVGLYGLLLRAFPGAHRNRYRHEMADAFERELAGARARGGVRATVRFALRAYLDALVAGAGERRRSGGAGGAGGFELGVGRDLVHAARSLSRSWAYSLVSLVSLAAGLGVTLTVMMLFRVTMEAPFEVDEEGLVEVLPTEEGQLEGAWSYPDFVELQERVGALELTGWTLREGSLRTEGTEAGQRVNVAYVSPGYFEVLRLEPSLGRGLPADGRVDGDAVPVIVSHGFWRNQMGEAPDVVGRVLSLNRAPHVVAGVAPEWFSFHDTRRNADAWVPLASHPALAADAPGRFDRGQAWIGVLGRLRDGSTREQAEAAVRAVAAGLAEAYPVTHQDRSGRVLPWHWQGAQFVSDDGWIAPALFGTLSGFLLLVVCLNLAGMAMVRGASRARELAVRLAIGSSRRRLVQVLMAEAVVLAAVGGILVVGVAWLALRIITARYGVPVPASAAMDAPAVAGWMAVAFGTTLVFGLIPALRFSRPDLLAVIKEDPGSGGRRSGFFHRLVASAQAGLAVPVLVVAVAVGQGALQITSVDFGVEEEGLVVWAPSDLAAEGYDAAAAERFARDLVREVGALPGVEAVVPSDRTPLDGRPQPVQISTPDVGTQATARMARVGPGWLDALGVPLLRGRSIERDDVPGAEPVAVVTAELAAELFPDGEPLRRRLTLEWPDGERREVTVVGVAGELAGQFLGVGEDHVLVALAQEPSTVLGLAVRAAPASLADDGLAEAIERIGLELDSELAQPNVAAFSTIVEEQSKEFSVWSAFFGVLAVLLLLLSALGVYGVVAFTVASRTKEIGLRMALGSSREQVLRKVLWDGARLALPGLALGALAGTAVAAQILNPMYVQIGLPLAGAGTLAAASAAAMGVVLASSFLPARRAASVDPLETLRAE